MRILVLSDNPDPSSLLMEQLQKLGYTDATRREFQQSVPSHPFDDIDVIFIDVLRQIDADGLVQLRRTTSAPLLLLSMPDDEQSLICAYQSGIDDHLEKPISPALLNAKLRVWQRWIELVDFIN